MAQLAELNAAWLAEREAMTDERDGLASALASARQAVTAQGAECDRLERAIGAQERIIAYRQSARWWFSLPWLRARLWWQRRCARQGDERAACRWSNHSRHASTPPMSWCRCTTRRRMFAPASTSVLAHLRPDVRLVLIDDASPDPAVAAYFAELGRLAHPQVVLLRNE